MACFNLKKLIHCLHWTDFPSQVANHCLSNAAPFRSVGSGAVLGSTCVEGRVGGRMVITVMKELGGDAWRQAL